jgi:nucleoside-diphosphate-sugar epimerase
MQIFLTGATGFVGGHCLRRLLRDGHQVHAYARTPDAAKALTAAGAAFVVGSWVGTVGTQTLSSALARCDAVVNCAAHLRMWGPWAEFEASNISLTRTLLQLAQAAGVRRFIQVSAASVVMDGPAALLDVDETAATTSRRDLPYSRSKAMAEALVLEAAGAGIGTLALRPPLVWGPGDTVDGALGARLARGRFGWFDAGRYPYATCHVDNLCEAIGRALHTHASGLACFVTDGEPVELRGFLSRRIEASGLEVPTLSVPAAAAWSMAGVLEGTWRLLHLASEPPLTREAVRLMGYPFTVSIDRARQVLGYRPVLTIEQGLRQLRLRTAPGQAAGTDRSQVGIH